MRDHLLSRFRSKGVSIVLREMLPLYSEAGSTINRTAYFKLSADFLRLKPD